MIFLTLAIGLVSCESIVGGNGYIYSIDNNPIDSVTVVIYLDGKISESTLSEGNVFFEGVNLLVVFRTVQK